MNIVNKIFTDSFNKLTDCFTIEYNPKWENGTGYLDHAVTGLDAPMLKNGEMRSCFDHEGRRIILIGTRFGNVVVFERTTDGAVFVTNQPREIRAMEFIPHGALSEASICMATGGWNMRDNIGFHIEKIAELLK